MFQKIFLINPQEQLLIRDGSLRSLALLCLPRALTGPPTGPPTGLQSGPLPSPPPLTPRPLARCPVLRLRRHDAQTDRDFRWLADWLTHNGPKLRLQTYTLAKMAAILSGLVYLSLWSRVFKTFSQFRSVDE